MPAHVLLINPNTSTDSTLMMTNYAQATAGNRLQIHPVTVDYGPKMIIDPIRLKESAAHVIDKVHSELSKRPYDAVIVSAIGDPGRQELSEQLSLPVVGIGESAIIVASRHQRPWAMATSTPLLADGLDALAKKHGGTAPFHGVFLTESEPLELAADPQRQYAELAVAVLAARDKGAQAVMIAGGPLSDTAKLLADNLDVAIIEPLPAAVEVVLERLDTLPKA
ncbi:MAG: aspartate/glutamate racemase family protein [Actinomycetaceae bacterium]|nr:aspartate/glutamate racemase family protein [Actinomycetaceae bacterium]